MMLPISDIDVITAALTIEGVKPVIIIIRTVSKREITVLSFLPKPIVSRSKSSRKTIIVR